MSSGSVHLHWLGDVQELLDQLIAKIEKENVPPVKVYLRLKLLSDKLKTAIRKDREFVINHED